MTTDEMQEELEKEGYQFHHFGLYAPDGWEYHPEISDERLDTETLRTELLAKRIEKAHAHLLQPRRMVAMEAENKAMKECLKQIVEWDRRFTQFPLPFMAEAKKLLGE